MKARKHPPYHLRPNKAVDRLTFIRCIRELQGLGENLKKYTYYGFGGPYLEDCRLIHEFYPAMKIVSFEEDLETYKRQEFHRPCSKNRLELRNEKFESFLTQYEANEGKSIFWLDYTNLDPKCFQEFRDLLGKVSTNTIVKLTLCGDWRILFENDAETQSFKDKYGGVIPADMVTPGSIETFAKLLQKMTKIAVDLELPGGMQNSFQKIMSHYYVDDSVMVYTLTGIVCDATEIKKVARVFEQAENAVSDWDVVRSIDLPFLSTKERLHLQKMLPSRSRDNGRRLLARLGYKTDGKNTEEKLNQYAEYYTCFPYFIKATP